MTMDGLKNLKEELVDPSPLHGAEDSQKKDRADALERLQSEFDMLKLQMKEQRTLREMRRDTSNAQVVPSQPA